MNKKITIQDIANIAGVSKTTVSFYLNGKSEKMPSQKLAIALLLRPEVLMIHLIRLLA